MGKMVVFICVVEAWLMRLVVRQSLHHWCHAVSCLLGKWAVECVGCGKFTNWQIFTITQHCLISKEVVSLLRSTLAALAVNSYLHWPNDNIWLTHHIKAGLAGCQQLLKLHWSNHQTYSKKETLYRHENTFPTVCTVGWTRKWIYHRKYCC